VSISFDRAAGYYDKTRALPSEQAGQVIDVLATELAGRGRVLEIGVGTGRMALPLHERGVDLVGVDISAPMLDRLVDNAGGVQPFPLIVADATRLPFASGSYDAVIASHVFHLIPDWRAATDESLRMLAAGGVLLVDFGRHGNGPWHEPMVEVFRERGVEREWTGVIDADEVASHFDGRAQLRKLPTVTIPIRVSLGELLDSLERQIMSWTWTFTPEQMRAACEGMREWAREHGVDLEEKQDVPYELQFWAYDGRV